MLTAAATSLLAAIVAISFVLVALPARAVEPPKKRLAPKATDEFYHTTKAIEVWNDANFQSLLDALAALEDHGLNPSHYHLGYLTFHREDSSARDRWATDAWFAAAAHLTYGKLDPISVEPDWTAARREADLGAVLRTTLRHSQIESGLDELAPSQPGYQHLLQALAEARAAADEPVQTISEGPTLRPQMYGDRVGALQRRLSQLGWLDPQRTDSTMDAPTVEAVRAFQASVGLDDDGVVGPATLAALNRGPAAQVEQLRVNLERWRWLPDNLGRRHLRANLADFNVTTYEDGQPVRSHLTVIGKPFRKTPVFSDEIEYLVFNPWWEVPASLARADKLPAFRRDPASVQRLGFVVLDRSGQVVDGNAIDWNSVSATSFPYRLRQSPGEKNALGQVKIMFPNQHNVYLHDTPTKGLFAQRQRAFSSGCLRTQDPIDLSIWLLAETPRWSAENVWTAVQSQKETRATLAQRVPVHILYFTAVSEPGGEVRFLDDVYDRDEAVLRGLRAAPH